MTSANSFHFKNALKDESLSIKELDNVLIHCPESVHVKSISSIDVANFSKEVHAELKSLRFRKLFPTQAIGWPHLMRGHSFILVNSAKTAKTWTYLPSICSLLSEAHDHARIVESDGPVMIIICMNSSEVNKVLQNCRNLLKRNLKKRFSCTAACAQNEDDAILAHLLNGIDILVTTIPCLVRLVKNPLKLFNKDRVTTIVFDEIDSMIDRFGFGNVDFIYKTFCTYSKIQFIVTSKTWHKALNKFCQKNDVLLYIGEYIEAAIYSSVDITVHFTNKDDQTYHNDKFLSCFKSKNYRHEPTVVICTDSKEVLDVSNILRSEGFKITFCHEKSDSSHINLINDRINRNHTNELRVVVCSDDVLSDLHIRHAQHIIHYSLPSYWTKFTFRFIASFDYYANLVQDKLSTGRPTSLILVDGNSLNYFPRLIEFMKTRCFTEVPKDITKLAEKKRMEQEDSRFTKYNQICANVLMFGECHSQYACSSRHILTKFDRTRENIPRNGDIKIKIIKVHNPVHYTVHLVEHRSFTKHQWQKIPYSDDYFAFEMEFRKYFKDSTNHIIHHSPEVGDLCAVTDDDVEHDAYNYKRCKIIDIDSNRLKLTLLLIDTNEIITYCDYNDILVLPDRFREFPAQAVDIRIGSIVPRDLDTTWDKKATKRVTEWFKYPENGFIAASIELTFMDCICVKSVEIKKTLCSIKEDITRLSINENLIKENIGVAESKSLEMLREMARRAGILDTQPHMQGMLNATTDQATKPHEPEMCEPTQQCNGKSNISLNSLETSIPDVDDSDNVCDDVYDESSYLNNIIEESALLDILNVNSDGSDEECDNIDIQFDEDDINELLATMGISPPVFEDVKTSQKLPTGPLLIKNEKQMVQSIHSQLVDPAKIPYLTWEQSDETITLTISAPDVKEYFLKVGLRHIHFSFVKANERFEKILNLFGSVEVEYTSHEIRGLNIIVRLMKTILGVNWPRLVQSPDKNRFIKYKFNNIEEDSGNDNDDNDDDRVDNNSSSNYTESLETTDDSDIDIIDFDL